jgi:hypothetical protein
MTILLGFLAGYWFSALFITKHIDFTHGYVTLGVLIILILIQFYNISKR